MFVMFGVIAIVVGWRLYTSSRAAVTSTEISPSATSTSISTSISTATATSTVTVTATVTATSTETATATVALAPAPAPSSSASNDADSPSVPAPNARAALNLAVLEKRRAALQEQLAAATAAGRTDDVVRLRDQIARLQLRIAVLRSAE